MTITEPTLNPAEHPEAHLVPVAEIHAPFDRFVDDYKKLKRPVVLRGYHKDDLAMNWTMESLRDRMPDQSVDLDVGDAMVTEGLTFEEMSLHDYINAIIEGNASKDGQTLYLQGFDIFENIPGLDKEISFPHLRGMAVKEAMRGWIGPKGTVTGYHADLGDNQLSQLYGYKLVKLIAPQDEKLVYRHKKYDPNGIACAVDADNWDQEKFPLLGTAIAQYVILKPGDSVFFPGGWYHYVKSLSSSISVNCVGYTPKQIAVDKMLDQGRRFLHNIGMYGETCTCHMMVDGKRVARR